MNKKHLVILTGAGISAESGLKTFRDGDGLWMGYNIQDVATPRAFAKDPALVLDFYNMRRREVKLAQPNAAHKGLAELEKDGVSSPHKILDIENDIVVGDKAADGSQLRPHIVWFEEPVPMIEKAAGIVQTADILVVIGTSLQVYPAAGLLDLAGDEVPKYILDKNIPEVKRFRNLFKIEMPATEGVSVLKERLKGMNK